VGLDPQREAGGGREVVRDQDIETLRVTPDPQGDIRIEVPEDRYDGSAVESAAEADRRSDPLIRGLTAHVVEGGRAELQCVLSRHLGRMNPLVKDPVDRTLHSPGGEGEAGPSAEGADVPVAGRVQREPSEGVARGPLLGDRFEGHADRVEGVDAVGEDMNRLVLILEELRLSETVGLQMCGAGAVHVPDDRGVRREFAQHRA